MDRSGNAETLKRREEVILRAPSTAPAAGVDVNADLVEMVEEVVPEAANVTIGQGWCCGLGDLDLVT